MKKRMIAVMLMLLVVGALSGCSAQDASEMTGTNAEVATTDPDTGTDNVEIRNGLTDNHSISCGPESALLTAPGTGFIPTGRQTAPEGDVRVNKSLVFEDDTGAEYTSTLVYAYDEAGRKVSSANQRPDGTVDVYETFAYDEQGRLFLHKDLSVDMMYLCTYDGEGRLQAVDHYDTRYDSDGVWKGQVVYSYDGNTVTESYYPGQSTTPEYYSVYADGKLLEYRFNGKYNQEWDFYEYDEQGNLKYMFSAEEGEKALMHEFLYDEHGILIEVLDYFGAASVGGSSRYFYNEAGDCIRIEYGFVDVDTNEWALEFYHEFTYDESGNLLTEKGFHSDGEPFYSYYIRYTYERIA